MTFPGAPYFPQYRVVLNEDLTIVPEPSSLWQFAATMPN